jgi:hypothetical protein
LYLIRNREGAHSRAPPSPPISANLKNWLGGSILKEFCL